MTAIGRLRDRARRHPHADIALATVVYAVVLLTTAAAPAGRLDPASVGVGALACGVLVVRRRWPFGVFLASALAAEAFLAMHQGHQGVMVLAAPLVALYTVAEAGSRRHALIIGALAVLALAGVHMLVKPSSWLGAENLALAAFGGLAVAAGDAARSRREYLAEVEARARRAEADRDIEAARRVTDERLRIARELHDVIGHQLAIINVQAGAATHVLHSQPAQAHQALGHIRAASKTALDELRDTIGLLRQPDEQATPTEPTTGLAGLALLLASFRRSGLTIAERVDGAVRPVPVTVDLAAYRVIQESLTNVCKHAGPSTVDLTLDYRPEALLVVVDNAAGRYRPAGDRPAGDRPAGDRSAGDRPASGGNGHGITGMRERVASLAGTLHAGPRPDGGYRVTAALPLPDHGALPLPERGAA
jgi:signal transduction histidine kinase